MNLKAIIIIMTPVFLPVPFLSLSIYPSTDMVATYLGSSCRVGEIFKEDWLCRWEQ